MSHHKDGHSDHPGEQRGEQEGFLDKVKDFFTGGDDRERRSDVTEQRDDLAEGQGETDSVASAGAGGGGVSESGWDGSDEPPELTVPENEAVAAYSDASEGDDGVAVSSGDVAPDEETEPLEDTGNAAVADYSDASDDDVAGETAESAESASGSTSEVTSAEDDEDYESRHGSGVDDSGVLADAPIEADAGGDEEAKIEGQGDGDRHGAVLVKLALLRLKHLRLILSDAHDPCAQTGQNGNDVGNAADLLRNP